MIQNCASSLTPITWFIVQLGVRQTTNETAPPDNISNTQKKYIYSFFTDHSWIDINLQCVVHKQTEPFETSELSVSER